jgi:3-methyl-2-oxobutanoate hydroxymethyltransferase
MYGSSASSKKVTVPEIRARKRRGPALAVVTAYDFTMARLVDEAGADVVLVGDSLGMVVQGLPTTLPVTLDEMCYHGRAVARGTTRAHLVGDMPFMSYQVSPAQAVESAGRLLKEGAFESVKLEGGEEIAEHVRRIVAAGIPVMGHVGLTPQTATMLGGYRAQGRTSARARQVLDDALALQEAGCFSIVFEAIPAAVTDELVRHLEIPVIGIGAGRSTDGQVLVLHDLLAIHDDFQPKFAKRFAAVKAEMLRGVRGYAEEVRTRHFPGPEHTYGIAPEELERFRADIADVPATTTQT